MIFEGFEKFEWGLEGFRGRVVGVLERFEYIMNFENRFSQQPSLSFAPSSIGQSISRDQPMDYFSDRRNQLKAPEKTTEQSKVASGNNQKLKPSANWTFDDQQKLRDVKRDEWRKGLLEQVQDKERKKQEEKNRKLMEDKKEEEKIAQERQLLEAKYKKEINSELGLPYEDEKPRKPKIVEAPKPVTKLKEPIKESPMPVIKELNQVNAPNPKFRNVEFNPLKLDYWKARSDLEIQQNSFKNILAKLKQDADQAHYERNEAMLELDRFREQLRMSSIDNDLRYQQKSMFNRNYSGNIGGPYKVYEPSKNYESFKNYDSHKISDDFFSTSKPLTYESKFVPLVNAGQSMMIPATNTSISRPDYGDIGFNEVRDQLVEIDQILTSSYE